MTVSTPYDMQVVLNYGFGNVAAAKLGQQILNIQNYIFILRLDVCTESVGNEPPLEITKIYPLRNDF